MKSFFHSLDWVLAVLISALALVGVMTVFSATHQSHELQNIWMRQLTWMLVSLVVMYTVSKVDYHIWLDISKWLYGAAVLFLFVVLFVGEATKGAQRWFRFGSLSFQPSELAKVAIILTLARFIGSKSVELFFLKRFFLMLALVGLPLILILKQPDLGSAMLVVPIILMMFYVGGGPMRWMAWLGILGLASTPIIWHFLRDYQKRRIDVFFNPQADPLGAGYNSIQSIIAIGSGGMAGKGFLEGSQTQLSFIPEHHTDFIFSVIGEEWGFAGTLTVVLLYLFLFRRAFEISQKARDREGALLAVGITGLYAVQSIINIGMSIGVFPVVGVTLPFISYGGTSLLLSFATVGILLNISYANRRPVLIRGHER
jgi:rod shape determining protein RodA